MTFKETFNNLQMEVDGAWKMYFRYVSKLEIFKKGKILLIEVQIQVKLLIFFGKSEGQSNWLINQGNVLAMDGQNGNKLGMI